MKKTLVLALLTAMLAPAAYASDVVTATNASEASYGDILWYSDPTPGHPTATYAQPSSVPGLTGATGSAGADGVNGTNGKDGKDGVNGVNGRNAMAPAIDPRLDVEVREFDSKHWSVSSGVSFALQTGSARYIVTQKLTLKLGKSYEEKQMERMEQRMQKLLRDSVLLPE